MEGDKKEIQTYLKKKIDICECIFCAWFNILNNNNHWQVKSFQENS